jgi:MFS family permease
MGSQVLGVGAALMNATMAVSSAAATLVVGDQLGVAWAALPPTAGILGTGLGSVLVSGWIARAGHRVGLRVGYLIALGGCAATSTATAYHVGVAGTVLELMAGLFLLGIGNASGQLSRYVAAELETPSRRAAAISLVTWIGTVGAVGGPLLLGPCHHAVKRAGLSGDCGPFLLASACVLLAVMSTAAIPRGRPAALPRSSAAQDYPPRAQTTNSPRSQELRHPFASPSARRALLAMAGAQVIMVAVMTAEPMNMDRHGSATWAIGAVLSAHTFGMFAFSPLTGMAVNRLGAQQVIRAGLAVLVASSAATMIAGGPAQAISLLLLGYGWNLCFIAGSSLLAGDLDITDRLAIEGRVDATVWAFAAGAGLLSTILLSLGGAAVLAAFAACVAIPVYTVLQRSHLAPASPVGQDA